MQNGKKNAPTTRPAFHSMDPYALVLAHATQSVITQAYHSLRRMCVRDQPHRRRYLQVCQSRASARRLGRPPLRLPLINSRTLLVPKRLLAVPYFLAISSYQMLILLSTQPLLPGRAYQTFVTTVCQSACLCVSDSGTLDRVVTLKTNI